MRAWGRATKRKDKKNKTCTIWEILSEKYHYGIMEDNRLWEKLYKSKEKAICRREEAYYGKKIYTIQKKTHFAGREESQKQQLLNKYFIYHTITVSMVHTMGVKDIHCYTEVETRTPPS